MFLGLTTTLTVLPANVLAIATDEAVSTVQIMYAVAHLRTTITTLATTCSFLSAQFEQCTLLHVVGNCTARTVAAYACRTAA